MKRSIILIIAAIFFVENVSSQDHRQPVLVLGNDINFGRYTGEMLRAEGFNSFQVDSLGDKLTLRYLKSFDLVILGKYPLSANQAKVFISYVKGGGNLVVFCPDNKLVGIFGIELQGKAVRDGYLQIKTDTGQGKGLKEVPLQIHGESEGYKLKGGVEIASLKESRDKETGMSAVVYNSYGKGRCVAFSYNLPRNIVYTRQGNPAHAGIEKDGIYGIRAMDMFTGGWVDTANNTINQADEQMHLLARCIEYMSAYFMPLPRFWYFPDTLKSIVTLTNDGEYMGEDNFEGQFRDIDSMGARMSLYILETGKVSADWAERWAGRGHEIAGHPDATNIASSPGWYHMKSALSRKRYEILDKYGLPVRTNANHWFVWCGRDSTGSPDFGAQAKLESAAGIKMNISYAHYDNNSVQGNFLGGPVGYNQGNFSGSGLVMKFADCRGRVLDIYQHFNNVYDQAYMEMDDRDGFFNCFKGLLDRSLGDGVYSCISIKAHNDEYFFSREPLMRMLSYAGDHGIPVWTAVKLLDFIEMKDEAEFKDIGWAGNRLSFRIHSALSHTHGLTCMVPYRYNGKAVSRITCNGDMQPLITRNVRGFAYLIFTVDPGSDYDIEAIYDKPE
jgi:hypothetical protein